MPPEVRSLLDRVDGERIAKHLLELVAIPSPTFDAEEAAKYYADYLTSIGLAPELVYFEKYPKSPTVVARLSGEDGGPTLQYGGHLDTIFVPSVPAEHKEGRIYGRGAADMKSGLVAAAEMARVLVESGLKLKGDLLFTAWDSHEEPGHGETVVQTIERGYKGDSIIICEGPYDTIQALSLGSSRWEVTVSRDGEATHELRAPAGTPHPIYAAAEVVLAMQRANAEFSKVQFPYVGSESYHVGQFHSGDFFNRFPNQAFLQGSRRYSPDKDFAEARAEVEALLADVRERTGANIDLWMECVRNGYRLDLDAPIVAAVRAAYQTIVGQEMGTSGSRAVGDATHFTRVAGIPAVSLGTGGVGAHADVEYVEVANVVRTAKTYLLSAVNYLGVA